MLAKCLLECHADSVKAGTPLALRVFKSGRGRLENEGSKALAEAFKVRVIKAIFKCILIKMPVKFVM
jgi:hypothetical protein